MVILYVLAAAAAVVAVLYFLAIMPRLSHRSERIKFTDVYYAHRGLFDNEGDAPENSLRAFERAAQAGYGIEMDVQLSRDGVAVVFHDFTLERMCGVKGKVSDFTWQELEKMRLGKSDQTIPRFEDVLKAVGGAGPLIVEIKVEWMDLRVCPVVDGLLKQYRGLYCIESFNPLVLLWYRRNHSQVMRGQLSDGFARACKVRESWHLLVQNFVLENLLFNWLTKPDFVAYNHRYASVLARRLCRGMYGNLAVAWTIRSQEELERAGKHFDLFIFDSFLPDTGEICRQA